MGAVEGEGDYYGFEPGQKLVLKFIKPEMYNSGIRITPADIASQKLAQTYAEICGLAPAFGVLAVAPVGLSAGHI